MKKKVLPMLLTASMVASMVSVPVYAAPFSDTDGHWGQQAIERWSDHGVVNGSDGEFRPNDSLTRAELAVIIANLLKLDKAAENNPFSDLDDSWYTDSILKCYEAGIMSGDGTNVRPNDPVTREEAMVILNNALKIGSASSGAEDFADGNQVSSWAEGAVNALLNAGVVNGVSETELDPQGLINRASVVTILNNAIGVYVASEGETVEANGGMVLVVGDNVTITGEADKVLILGDSKDVALDNLTVEGDVTVTGESTKVALSGETAVGSVTIADSAAGASLEVGADAAAGDVTVAAKEAEVSVNGQADSVTASGENTTINVSGKVDEVSVAENAAGSTLTVAKDAEVGTVSTEAEKTEISVQGTVDKVEVAETAGETAVKVDSTGKVDTVETKAESVEVSGKGEVSKVEASGDNTAVTTPGTKVEAGEGTTGVTAGGDKVEAGESSTTDKTTSGGGGGGGSTSTDSKPKNYTVTFNLEGYTVPSATVRKNNTVAKPELTGYVAPAGTELVWFNGETAFDFNTGITADTTLTGKLQFADYNLIEAEILSKTASFKEHFYNKPKGTTFDSAEVTNDRWFFDVATSDVAYINAITSVSLNGGDPLDKGEFKVSVGNSNSVYAKLYKTEGDKLYIALPIIALEKPNSDNQLVFTINAEGYADATVAVTVPAMTNITSSTASAVNGDVIGIAQNGSTYDITIKKHIVLTNWKHQVNFEFNGGLDFDQNTVFFTKKENKNDNEITYGFTEAESNGALGYYVPLNDSRSTDDFKYTVATADRYGAYTMTLNISKVPAEGTFVVSTAEELIAAAGQSGDVTIALAANIDMAGKDWTAIPVTHTNIKNLTIEGNGKTISNLNNMLVDYVSQGYCSVTIKDLTLEGSKITTTQDSDGTGAFIGMLDGGARDIVLNNCHLKNAEISGGDWTGGFIGYAAGYNDLNDGPCFLTIEMKNCSVTNSEITGAGSTGAIIGHATGNPWTKVTIDDATITGNTVSCTDDSNVKAGIVLGTVGVAGLLDNGRTGGTYVNRLKYSNNTVTSNDTPIDRIYGRQGNADGRLYLDGVQIVPELVQTLAVAVEETPEGTPAPAETSAPADPVPEEV